MRVAVVGATGNVGTAVLRALRTDSRISAVAGVARRLPKAEGPYAGVRWHWRAGYGGGRPARRSVLNPPGGLLFAGLSASLRCSG